jgi:hypothetical protein
MAALPSHLDGRDGRRVGGFNPTRLDVPLEVRRVDFVGGPSLAAPNFMHLQQPILDGSPDCAGRTTRYPHHLPQPERTAWSLAARCCFAATTGRLRRWQRRRRTNLGDNLLILASLFGQVIRSGIVRSQVRNFVSVRPTASPPAGLRGQRTARGEAVRFGGTAVNMLETSDRLYVRFRWVFCP